MVLFKNMKKRFKSFITKDDFNNIPRIDPLEYHSIFIKFAKIFAVMDYGKKTMWMHPLSIFLLLVAVISAMMALVSLGHHIRRLHIYNITECATYLFLMLYQMVMILAMGRGRKNYGNLLQSLKDDYTYIYTRGQKYKKQFFENQLLTFQGSVATLIINVVTSSIMTICYAISTIIALATGTVTHKRPLMFQLWIFNFNLRVSPVYEVLFVFSMMNIIVYAFLYSFMMLSYVIWIRQITSKADIIIWNLQDLLIDITPTHNLEKKEYYNTLIKHRMREIIQMHHAMYGLLHDYADVYKKCLLYEQTTVAPGICMTAYCFSEKYNQTGEFAGFLLMLCIGCIAVSFIPNYLCTHLLEKVESVGQACWETPFWNAGPVSKGYLVLIMLRSKRRLPVTAPGFQNISLETYAMILTRAYSWLNMLRQADIDLQQD